VLHQEVSVGNPVAIAKKISSQHLKEPQPATMMRVVILPIMFRTMLARAMTGQRTTMILEAESKPTLWKNTQRGAMAVL
jgi:hypothetical protein